MDGNTGYGEYTPDLNASAGYDNPGINERYDAGYVNPGYDAGYVNPGYANAGYVNQGYINPGFNQGYPAPGYDASYTMPDLQGFQEEPIRCPGKEIVALVFGINALFWGVFAVLFCW